MVKDVKLTGFVVLAEVTSPVRARRHDVAGEIRTFGPKYPLTECRLELLGGQVVDGGLDALVGQNVEVIVRLKPETT